MRLVETPPIRRLFVPKDGYTLFEADLKRGDPQCVAKESEEESLIQVFRDGIDVYTDMGKWLYETQKISKEQRQWNKNGINAANYAVQPKTMATTLHTTLEKAEKYLERWRGPTGLYPGIGKWHRRVDTQLLKTRTVRNIYGYRRYYTDRHENLLPKALAWLCSSAVSITIDRGMKHVFGPNVHGLSISEEDLFDPWSEREYTALPQVEILMQIHDSIIGQFPTEMADYILPKIVERMEVEIPYKKPLIIPITLKAGVDGVYKNGDCPFCDMKIDKNNRDKTHEHKSWGDLANWKEAA